MSLSLFSCPATVGSGVKVAIGALVSVAGGTPPAPVLARK